MVVTDKDVEKVRRDIEDIVRFAAYKEDLNFFYPLFSYVEIYVTDDPSVPTAAAVNKNIVVVNRDFWYKLKDFEKPFTILHELMHIMLKHNDRAMEILREKGALFHELWNIAADGLINDSLLRLGLVRPETFKPIYLDTISNYVKVPPSSLRTMSTEQIYSLLVRQIRRLGAKTSPIPVVKDILPRLPRGARRAWQGGEARKAITKKEIEEGIKRVAREAEGRMAGRGLSGVAREIDELLRPKINWRAFFRTLYSSVASAGRVLTTWSRIHRRLPALYPGYIRLKPPPVYVLVDISGSISDEEVVRFSSEVLGIVREHGGTVYVIPWSDGAWGPFEVKTRSDIVKAIKSGESGGTVLRPALVLLEKQRVRPNTFVVIFTDGHIFDINEPDTRRLLDRISRKCYVIMVCTDVVPSLPPRVKAFKYKV